MKNSNEILVTTMKAAEKLGIHYNTMLRLRKMGLVPYFKYGRGFMFKESDLVRFLESHYFEAYISADIK